MVNFEGNLSYGGNTISNTNINHIIYWCNKYHLLPSAMICQTYLESFWGNAGVGADSTMNNWGGITWFGDNMFGGNVPYEKGSPRPANEGGYYVRFYSMSDYFHAHAWLLGAEKYGGSGIYKCSDKGTVQGYANGLFKYGGARENYAASWEGYEDTMLSIERGILRNNPNFNDVNSSTGFAGTTSVNLIIPVKGATPSNVTSSYGWRTHPITGEPDFHNALDIANGCSIDVLAVLDGVVSEVSYPYPNCLYCGETGYGNYVTIIHGNGWRTRYAHLEKINVIYGERVKQGKVIGLVGSTGSSTGCHLHFELRKEGITDEMGYDTLDPYPYLFEGKAIDLPQPIKIKRRNQKEDNFIYVRRKEED